MILFIELSLDESVSDVMKEMQVKWKNTDEETRKVNNSLILSFKENCFSITILSYSSS